MSVPEIPPRAAIPHRTGRPRAHTDLLLGAAQQQQPRIGRLVAAVEHEPPHADALMALYGLTPMEARVLLQIAAGKRRSEAAQSLGIADSTAKTHLDRIYAKTGTSDQPTLARLVASLSSPARNPG